MMGYDFVIITSNPSGLVKDLLQHPNTPSETIFQASVFHWNKGKVSISF